MLDLLAFKATDVPAENLIENGDFSQEIRGWRSLNLESVEVVDGTLVMISGDSSTSGRVDQQLDQVSDGDVIYQGALMKSESSHLGLGQGPTHTAYHTGSGEYEWVSGTRISGSNFYFSVILGEHNESAYVKNVICINLTKTFGSGNEPSTEQVDFLLNRFTDNWFSGTVNLFNADQFMKMYFNEANNIPDNFITNEMLEPNFLYSGRIDPEQSIDTVYNDGTFIVTSGNPGTFPPGESNVSWILEVKRIDGVWTYQTIYKLYNPETRYVRLVRSNTGQVYDWHKYQIESGATNKVYKILMVGNSFALDTTSYLHHIAASAGIDIIVGILYRDGEGLESHYDNAINKTNTYRYYRRVSSSGEATGGYESGVDFDTAVTDEEWDLITFQQRSGHSDDYSSYQPYLNDLKAHIEGIATNEDVEFGIHQTWAYSTSRREDQIGMYNDIVDAYEQAMRDADIGILIPNGTSIQNSRDNEYLVQVDDELTDDGIHLGETGDYIAALTMFESLLSGRYNKDIFTDVKYIPSEVSKFHAYLSKLAAKNAVLNPFKVTQTK